MNILNKFVNLYLCTIVLSCFGYAAIEPLVDFLKTDVLPIYVIAFFILCRIGRGLIQILFKNINVISIILVMNIVDIINIVFYIVVFIYYENEILRLIFVYEFLSVNVLMKIFQSVLGIKLKKYVAFENKNELENVIYKQDLYWSISAIFVIFITQILTYITSNKYGLLLATIGIFASYIFRNILKYKFKNKLLKYEI